MAHASRLVHELRVEVDSRGFEAALAARPRSGCRPGASSGVRWRHVDDDIGRLIADLARLLTGS